MAAVSFPWKTPKRYNIFDTPDNDDCLKKVCYGTFYGGVFGRFFGYCFLFSNYTLINSVLCYAVTVTISVSRCCTGDFYLYIYVK